MPLVNDSIPNLINGVSQQPYTLRLPSQAEAQSNFHSTPVEGLRRRPPTKHLTKLTGTWSGAFTHPIDRDETEQYMVKVSGGDLEVFDMAGVAQTVNFPSGKAYLAGTAGDFKAVTVADYTFIVNSSFTPAMTSAVAPTRFPEALVHIRTGNYGRTFKVFINGSPEGTYVTPDGGVASDANKIDTDWIAAQLRNDLIANLDPAEFLVRRVASTLRIESLTGTDFTVYAEDGTGGQGSVVVKDKVQKFTDLPRAAFRDFTVEVVGDNTSSFDNYYVSYESPDAIKDTDGVWKETVQPGALIEIDAATMPHTLVRESDGTFTFGPADWADRLVGDSDSAPEPSFIGRPINDVFFYRNRLGFLADENVIMSEAGGFFNFFPTTVTTILDGNSIDVAASHNRVAILKHAISFNEQLLLFSDDTQFILEGGAILTPNTVRIQQTTEYESNPAIKPRALGSHVYFPVKQGEFSGVREYYVSEQGEANEAVDTTSHVPAYVPANVSQLIGSSSLDLLLLRSDSTPNRLYVYKFFFSGRDKLQSSWYTWDFAEGDEIISMTIIETSLFLIINRADGVYLEVAALGEGVTAEGSDVQYFVDRQITEADFISMAYDAPTDTTTITLPYPEAGDLWVFARAGSLSEAEGRVYVHTRPDDLTVEITGDVTGESLCIGRRVKASYTFSPFLVRDRSSSGSTIPVIEGRLQILYLNLSYADTGYFKVTVTPAAGDTFEYVFTPQSIGTSSFILDELITPTGQFQLPVYARNLEVEITVETDHFLPATFMSAEWEGRYRTRSRRL